VLVFVVRVRPGSFHRAREDVPIWVIPNCSDVRIVALLLFRHVRHAPLPEAPSLEAAPPHSIRSSCGGPIPY
jgi:hypothetical protein